MSLRRLNHEEVVSVHGRVMACTDDLISKISKFNRNIEANVSNRTWANIGDALAVRDNLALAAATQGSISPEEYTEITGKAF